MSKMVWWGGELVQGTHCEDAPCCGCCGPGSDDPAYHEQEAEPYDPDDYLSDGGPYDDGFDGPPESDDNEFEFDTPLDEGE